MQEKQDIKEVKRPLWANIGNFLSELWGDSSMANDRLLAAIRNVGFCIAAFFLGSCELMFATRPLGIALLCAADSQVAGILVGLLFASSSPVYAAVCIITVVVRVLVRLLTDTAVAVEKARAQVSAEGAAIRLKTWLGGLFKESVWIRMSASAVAVFCLSLYSMIVGGFRYYDLFGAFFALATAPVAVFVYSGFFDGELRKTALHGIGILGLLVSLTYAMRNFTFFGIYGGAFVAFFATLCAGRRRGMLVGCVFGLCLGLAFDPRYAPLFILEAAAAGVLWNVSSLAAATAGCVVGIIWGVYVNGLAALSELLPALLCGAMIFGAADRMSLINATPELIRPRVDGRAGAELLAREGLLERGEQNMKALSDAFSELGEAFHSLSDRLRRPAVLDLRRMCDSVFDSYCPSCSKREVCWGSEYADTLSVMNRLTADLHTKARAEEDSVPEYMRERCAVMPRMISQINESCARLTEQALLCDRTGVFAANYEGIAQILAEALEMSKNDSVADEEAGVALAEQLKKQRIGFDGVLVYGGRRRSVAIKGLDTSRARMGAADLRGIISDAVGARLGELKLVPSAHLMDLTASAERRFSASRYYFSLPSPTEGEGAVCGDTVCEFSTPADRYYSILSDGMGSGKEAALTSRVCSVFLEKMLIAGNRCETSLKLLNSFMSEHDGRSRSEYSVGLDVMELDLLTGELALIKSGAVPTYIKRGGNCFKLGAKTMPLGIMDEPDMQRLSFNAESGDMVIMVSDGVTRGREDCVWLLSMLTSEWSDGPETMARMIAERARVEGSDDDITVSIVQIK